MLIGNLARGLGMGFMRIVSYSGLALIGLVVVTALLFSVGWCWLFGEWPYA